MKRKCQKIDYDCDYDYEKRARKSGTWLAELDMIKAMNLFGVTPEKESELRRRMAACGLHEVDLEESFIRSGGPGGQKVNRSSTCVRLRHAPSGVEVKMQVARSQGLNRFYARRRLCELLEAQAQGHESPEARERDKIARQKARRRRRTKNKQEGGAGESGGGSERGTEGGGGAS